jgi:hypothetical protein
MYYIMSYSKLFKPYLKSNVLCGNFGTVQVKKLQDMITAEELTTFVAMQFEQRLNNLLRSFPIQDVGKEESELRKQVCSFCEAVVTEQQHPDSEFSTVSSEVATMVIDLLSIGNVVALQRGAATLNNLNQQQSSSSVVAFFTKHKVGQLLTQASAEVMVEGAARVAVEKAMQDTSAALAVVKELPKAGEEELSGVVAVYLEKSKLAGQEIAAMKKQGTHMARTTSKCANDLDQMAREFWAWLNKALRSELSNTARGVLEESAALLGPEQASVDQFSIQDVEHVLKCKEVVKHAVWDRLSAELEKEKKILKLFDFYATLAEQATNLIKFALSTQSRTQCLFQGAAVPPKPRPETLRRFKDIPDQLNEICQESDFSSARGWQELLAAVDEELQDQESAGFKALGVLINDFVAGRPEASKARLEDVKRMIPQKFEARELVDTAFQA